MSETKILPFWVADVVEPGEVAALRRGASIDLVVLDLEAAIEELDLVSLSFTSSASLLF